MKCRALLNSESQSRFVTESLVQLLHLREFKAHIPVQDIKSNVKVTLVQTLMLCTGRTAHRGSRGKDLPFHDHGTRRV